MSKASAARRLATAAAYGGGGLGLVGGSLYGLLNLEAKIARMRIGNADESVPRPQRPLRRRTSAGRRSGSPCSATPPQPATAQPGRRDVRRIPRLRTGATGRERRCS